MPTITLIREPAAVLVDPDANVDRQPDWESPSGCDEAPFPRLQRPADVFQGPGNDLHWIGQGCDVVDIYPADGDRQAIVLMCGCRARVHASTLRPAR